MCMCGSAWFRLRGNDASAKWRKPYMFKLPSRIVVPWYFPGYAFVRQWVLHWKYGIFPGSLQYHPGLYSVLHSSQYPSVGTASVGSRAPVTMPYFENCRVHHIAHLRISFSPRPRPGIFLSQASDWYSSTRAHIVPEYPSTAVRYYGTVLEYHENLSIDTEYRYGLV